MQFCSPHWERLKAAITDRGLFHLVAKSGEEATTVAIEQLEGDESNANWDPLMTATFMIYNRFLETVGLAGMGEFCPLCEAQKGLKRAIGIDDGAEQWIVGCTDAVLVEARQRKLVPGAQ